MKVRKGLSHLVANKINAIECISIMKYEWCELWLNKFDGLLNLVKEYVVIV